MVASGCRRWPFPHPLRLTEGGYRSIFNAKLRRQARWRLSSSRPPFGSALFDLRPNKLGVRVLRSDLIRCHLTTHFMARYGGTSPRERRKSSKSSQNGLWRFPELPCKFESRLRFSKSRPENRSYTLVSVRNLLRHRFPGGTCQEIAITTPG